jgi:2-C-methyl-D-erythritol 2,4-cyclodiphosphate synthase
VRVGIGYDVHVLAEGRRLRLGGVEFDHPRGLVGHSDADVVLHAIADALLGAAALGDIGQHFPPGDDRYRDADSLDLLRAVGEILFRAGWQASNVDVTVIAEEPRIGPRALEMRQRIADAIGIPAGAVSVKATTNEKLGFIGRAEGIAAMAVATIVAIGTGGPN